MLSRILVLALLAVSVLRAAPATPLYGGRNLAGRAI
jgi:hypothetical protein